MRMGMRYLPLARVPLAEAMERQQADDGPEDQACSDHGIRSLLHHLAKRVLAGEQSNAEELHTLERGGGFWLEVLRCRDRLIVRHRRGRSVVVAAMGADVGDHPAGQE